MSRKLELLGQKFNRLLVIEEASRGTRNQTRWRCLCDCENICVVNSSDLTSGHTRSCGCWTADAMKKRRKDLTGLRLGKLTVLRQCENPIWGRVGWVCQCDCGNAKNIVSSSLVEGKTRSCGCEQVTIIKTFTERKKGSTVNPDAALRVAYSLYKNSAKQNERLFTISLQQFKQLVFQNCHYCGSEPKRLISNVNKTCQNIINGIDRKDSSLGYIIENCLPCCTQCNYAKMDIPYKDFMIWIQKLVSYHEPKGYT